MIDTWIDRDGKKHTGGSHGEISYRLFPDSENPERTCEKLGWVKVGTWYNGSPYQICDVDFIDNLTEAQKESLKECWAEHYASKRVNNQPKEDKVTPI